MKTLAIQSGTATEQELSELGRDAVLRAKTELPQIRTKANETEDLGDRVVRFRVSDETVDRMGDIVRQDWRMKNFGKNPVILWGHDDDQPPIGKALAVELQETQSGPALSMDIEFAPRSASPFADTVFELVRGGYLKSTSVGFLPHDVVTPPEDEAKSMGLGPYGVEFRENELLETSVVSIPANPNAVREGLGELVSRGFVGALDADRFREDLVRSQVERALERFATDAADVAAATAAIEEDPIGRPAAEVFEEIRASLESSHGASIDVLERILAAVQAQARELTHLRRALAPASRRGLTDDAVSSLGQVASIRVADIVESTFRG